MAFVSDNFIRANGALGGNWSAVISNKAESGPNTLQGGILINNNGYGPTNAFGGDAAAFWIGQSFETNQWARAVVKTVAPYTAVLSITAATKSGNNVTYTYTVTSGSVAAAISGGALYIKISGMTNAGNNGTFTTTTFGAGTFTVANASGATEAGSSGTGNCPSDSGAGVLVRGSGNSASTLNGYFFHVGSNSFAGDGRIAYRELWKVVNGFGTLLAFDNSSTILPVPGNVVGILAVGSTITAYYNDTKLFQVTDTDLASGVPGLWAWSISGSGEYVWTGPSGWTNQPIAPGNNGTTLNNFSAGDLNLFDSQLTTDSLTEGSPSQAITDSFSYVNGDLHTTNVNWVYGAGAFQVSSNKVYSSVVGINSTYRSDRVWPNNQYSEVKASIMGAASGQNCGPAVRVGAGALNFYGVQYANDIFRLVKDVAGVFTILVDNLGPLAVDGDIIRLEVVGNLLTVFRNGIAVPNMTNIADSDLASGSSGIWGAGNATTNGFSSWKGDGIVSILPSQFTTQTGVFFSDVVSGVYANRLDTNSAALAYQNSVVWPNDQFSQVVMSGISISGQMAEGPSVRMQTGASTAYRMYPKADGNVYIDKYVNGVFQGILTQAPYTFKQNDVFRLEVQGTLLVGRINGAAVIAAFDSAISGGKPGFHAANIVGNPAMPTGTFKNWIGGSVLASSTPTSGTASLGTFFGASLAAAISNPSSSDLIQVINEGNQVVWNLTASGVSNTNPTNPTPGAILGKFSGANFVAAFLNSNNLDIFQVIGPGGGVVFHVNSSGVASSP